MFTTSTQKHYWIFPDDETLKNIRDETNKKFVTKFRLKNGMTEEVSDYFCIYKTLNSTIYFMF